jgi:hypothetical protein
MNNKFTSFDVFVLLSSRVAECVQFLLLGYVQQQFWECLTLNNFLSIFKISYEARNSIAVRV